MNKNLVIDLADANLALAMALQAVEDARKAVLTAEEAIAKAIFAAKAKAIEAIVLTEEVDTFFASVACEKDLLESEVADVLEQELPQEEPLQEPIKKAALPWKETIVGIGALAISTTPIGQALCLAVVAPVALAAAAAKAVPTVKTILASWGERLNNWTANLQAI